MITDVLKLRRSYYKLNKELPISHEEVEQIISDVVELIPDAFNMKSQRVIVTLGDKQDVLWDTIYDAFEGKVSKEKIDSFKAAAGTVLYYTDLDVVKGLQDKFPRYADNFPIWASQSNGMVQINIWTALREMNIGANIQHYNPVIDEAVKQLLNVPDSWQLIAQMPFGGIVEEPDPKEKEDISKRVWIEK